MTERGHDDLACLEETYRSVPVGTETFEVPPMEFKRLAARAEKDALGGARAVPRRGEAVLLVRTIDEGGAWGVPGGEREPDETHEETAVRAVREETGLDVTVGSLLAVKRYEFVDAFDPDGRVVGHWAWFGGTDEGGPAEPQHPGVLEAGWFTEVPEDVEDTVAERIGEWIEREQAAAD